MRDITAPTRDGSGSERQTYGGIINDREYESADIKGGSLSDAPAISAIQACLHARDGAGQKPRAIGFRDQSSIRGVVENDPGSARVQPFDHADLDFEFFAGSDDIAFCGVDVERARHPGSPKAS